MLNPVAPFRTALRERNIRRLLAGLAASQAGDWLYNLALLALVYERTHSSVWVGLTTGARVIPAVVLGPLAGILADRVDRRVLMLGSDTAAAATMAGLAVVAFTHGPIVLVPVLAAVCTAAVSPYIPCVVAVMPRLATDEQLPAANAARVSIQAICIVGGPLFGAVLMLLGSLALAFIVNGATFLLGALAVSGLPREALRRPAAHDVHGRPGLGREIATGWHALRGYSEAMGIVGANVIASAVYGALTVLLVILGYRLGLGAAGYGYLLAALGAGGALAAGVSNKAAGSSRPRRALILSMIAGGAPLPVLGIVSWLPAAIMLAAICGAGSVVAEVVGDTCLQRELDPAVFARAYGLVLPACLGGIVAGAVLAPVTIALVGFQGALAVIGAGVVAYGVLVLARPPVSHSAVAAVTAVE